LTYTAILCIIAGRVQSTFKAVTKVVFSIGLNIKTEDDMKVLKYKGDVVIPATDKPFYPHLNFKAISRGTNIGCSEFFRAMFLGGKHIESTVPCHMVSRFRVNQGTDLKAIQDDIGDDTTVTVPLSDVFHLLMEHINGEDSPLLFDGASNLFFVNSIVALIQVVELSHRSGRPYFDAISTPNDRVYFDDRVCVFARKTRLV